MDGILRISGNYCFAPNKWKTQDPFFTGKVLVDDEGKFFGYIRMSEEQKYSITGALATNSKNGHLGIAFYVLPNYTEQSPVLYVQSDIEDSETCERDILECRLINYSNRLELGYETNSRQRAKLMLEQEKYSACEAVKIKELYGTPITYSKNVAWPVAHAGMLKEVIEAY